MSPFYQSSLDAAVIGDQQVWSPQVFTVMRVNGLSAHLHKQKQTRSHRMHAPKLHTQIRGHRVKPWPCTCAVLLLLSLEKKSIVISWDSRSQCALHLMLIPLFAAARGRIHRYAFQASCSLSMRWHHVLANWNVGSLACLQWREVRARPLAIMKLSRERGGRGVVGRSIWHQNEVEVNDCSE